MTIYTPNTGTKKNLNTGTPGQAGTADTINAGGAKIAENFNQIYDALGDLRVTSSGATAGKQFIHPGGVYQYIDQNAVLYPGGLYTVDTTNIIQQELLLTLPPIQDFSYTTYDGTYAVSGTRIVIQDATKSWSNVGIKIETSPGDTITGAIIDDEDSQGTQKIYVSVKDQEVTLVAHYDVESGNTNWNVSIKNNNTFSVLPSETDIGIDDDQENIIELLDVRTFNSIKYLIYSEEIDSNGYVVRNGTSEVLLLSLPEQQVSGTPTEMSSTQYAGIVWDTNDSDYSELFEYEFLAYIDAASQKPVASLAITSNIIAPNTLNIVVKPITLV